MDTNTVNSITQALQSGEVNFEFTKQDGSTRAMTATLNEEVIGEAKQYAGESYLTVYEADKSQWRNIRLDTIKRASNAENVFYAAL